MAILYFEIGTGSGYEFEPVYSFTDDGEAIVIDNVKYQPSQAIYIDSDKDNVRTHRAVVAYVNSKLHKEVYAPCELVMTVNVSYDQTLEVGPEYSGPLWGGFEKEWPHQKVREFFIKKRVRMSSGKKLGNLATNYYIHSVNLTELVLLCKSCTSHTSFFIVFVKEVLECNCCKSF